MNHKYVVHVLHKNVYLEAPVLYRNLSEMEK